jgi:hypothetical protein
MKNKMKTKTVVIICDDLNNVNEYSLNFGKDGASRWYKADSSENHFARADLVFKKRNGRYKLIKNREGRLRSHLSKSDVIKYIFN